MSKRFKNFDYLRGLSIIGVVLIHVTAPMALDRDVWSIVINQIARFGVPIFVFLSGWGLTISKSYQRAPNYLEFLKKRVSKLLPSYLVWNVIYWAYTYWIASEEVLNLSEFIRGFFLGKNYPHLYFVPLIILFYILYPILLRMGETRVGLFMALLITIFSQIDTWGDPIEGLTRDQNPFNWLIYFVFGIWVARNMEKTRQNTLQQRYSILSLAILSMIFIVVEPFLLEDSALGDLILIQTRPSVILYSGLLILLFMILPIKLNGVTNFLNEVGASSYRIYLSHYLFVHFYRDLYLTFNLDIASFLYIPTMFGLVLFSTYLTAKGYDKASHFIRTN